MYPRIVADISKLQDNYRFIKKELDYLDLFVVTKCFSSHPTLIKAIYDAGIRNFADSRILNIKTIKETVSDATTMLLRLPAFSEIEDVIKYADISLNSELETINKLNIEAKKQNIVHKIILMIDLGDLREGIMYNSDYINFISEVLKLDNIELHGIGTNVTCYGAIIPSKETLEILVNIKNEVKEKLNYDIKVISGGNSSSYHLHLKNELPKEINNLRIGEVVVLGSESAYGQQVKGIHRDVFKLETEVIEVKDKPSHPIGEIGVNAFGEKLEYLDKGIHRRAIVSIGRQDVHHDNLYPSKGITIIGSSSDHLILEVDESINVGDIITFDVEYASLLMLYTSKYVYKIFK